jgi:hypothetical protein
MPTRPTSWPSWATAANYPAGSDPWSGTPTVVAPSGGQQAAGYAPNAKPPAQWENWFKNKIASGLDWLRHLPTVGDDTPQSVFTDAAGNNRYLIDHNGYPMGRRSEFREEWIANIFINAVDQVPVTNANRWSFSHAGQGQFFNPSPTGSYSSPYGQVKCNAAAGSRATLWSSQVMFIVQPFISAVFEFEASIQNPSSATEYYVGLANGFDDSTVYAWFVKRGGDTEWQAEARNTASVDIQSTGVVPATGAEPAQRFRIELYGSSSPYGACARFFINDVLRVTHASAQVPAWINSSNPAEIRFMMTVKSSNTTSPTLSVGPILGTWNRQLSIPAL